MPEITIENTDVRKLARAYIALALAQDEAKRYVSQNSAQSGFLPLLTSLDITAGLLEEVLERAMPANETTPAASIACFHMVM